MKFLYDRLPRMMIVKPNILNVLPWYKSLYPMIYFFLPLSEMVIRYERIFKRFKHQN